MKKYKAPKYLKFRLTFDVEYDPQGTSKELLRNNLATVARNAIDNGTLTGDTPAELGEYTFRVTDRR